MTRFAAARASSRQQPLAAPNAQGHPRCISEEQIERYPGSSPADIFRGAPGVLSGESRNSGGVDVNIRGMQGMGRVAVTVDGAQNANSAYRGYQGISNRSYIDPDFIGGIAIEKGPSISATGASSIGGSVAITTVNANDIIPEGASRGFRFRLGGGTNTSPVSPNFSTFAEGIYDNGNVVVLSPGERPGLLDPTSVSGSLLYASTSENLDIVLGFARRRAGNYHAGTRGDGVPTRIDCDDDAGITCGYDWYKAGLTPYMPGEEVLNTSVDTYSGLAKATVRFADDHSLELGFNRYSSLYGEVNPMNYYKISQHPIQHALSEAQVDNYTARYRWNPDSDIWDLKWNFWYSDLSNDNPSTQAGRPTVINGSRSSWANSWGTDLSNTSTFDTTLGKRRAPIWRRLYLRADGSGRGCARLHLGARGRTVGGKRLRQWHMGGEGLAEP